MKNILKDLIAAQPDRKINYEQYINTVLYHPEKGYYHKPNVKIGKSGDFFTSPAVHPVFGHVMARFFIDVIEKENLSPVICEIGGGDGHFAEAVLEEWQRVAPCLYKDLQYVIVEESGFHRNEQKKRLPVGKHVIQYRHIEQLQNEQSGFCGILFSNELFDAFPVRVVQKADGKLKEVKVTMNRSGELEELLAPCRDENIVGWIKKYGFTLQEGQRLEIPLVMTRWLEKTADWLAHGALITVDYGYTAEEWLKPNRRGGSLRGYFRHQLVMNPLLYPGEMDVTAHIHLDAIEKIARDDGLTHYFTMPQRQFLLAAGILDDLTEDIGRDPFSPARKKNRAVQSLISDSSLGSAFHVMMQGKQLFDPIEGDWFSEESFKKAIEKRR